MNCLGNEVAKNVILAGVAHVTILDPTVLSKGDMMTQFLPSSGSLGKNVWDLSVFMLSSISYQKR